ncbi:MAG: site-specific integrase [Geobacter sp.]|nr:MAG: site-specific integrase [Geobacter sp.]
MTTLPRDYPVAIPGTLVAITAERRSQSHQFTRSQSSEYADVSFGSNLVTIWVNKGDRPRSVPMTKRVRMILEERQQMSRVKPFGISKPEMERAWQWCRAEMGLNCDKEFVLHALRHTCASRLVNAGVDLYVVKELLGHSSIQITERYAHLNPVKLVQAVEVLEVPRSQHDCEDSA